MQIIELKIRRSASYDTPPLTLQATVTMEGPTGKQEVVLSSRTLIEIFKVIRSELMDNALVNAKMTKNAIEEAINGPLLEEQTKLQIETR